ncbi:MAG TPA: hypothetical protein VF815_30905 [Myxococcaceae bacterium]|jgi:hypothetical protein
MQAGGSQQHPGSWSVAVLWALCLALNAGCGASSPPRASPAAPDTFQGDAGTPPDAGIPDAGSALAGCSQTTLRWQITPEGNVYSGRAERQYDADGKLLQEQTFSSTEALLSERVYEYEPSGQLKADRARVVEGDRTSTTDIQLTYLADGRLLTRTTLHQWLFPGQAPRVSSTRERRTYGADGLLQQEERLDEDASSSLQLLHTYSYDAQGRLGTVETFYRGQPHLRRVATYDGQGRLSQVDRFGEYGGGPDLYTYPAEGGWSVTYRAPGWLETWRYDAQGRLLEMRTGHDSGSGSESFSFDAEGRLLTQGKGVQAGRYSGGEGHTHTYDAEGRRVSTATRRRWSDSHTSPIDFSEEHTLATYTYDAAGQFRMREERVVSARHGHEGIQWESAPPGFVLERTEARGPHCRPPPDAPPPQDTYAFPR